MRFLPVFYFFLILPACSPGVDPTYRPEEPEPEKAENSTRFERLSPEQTGIRFTPVLTEDYRYNFSMDPYIYNGGGVAVIDVNNDGLQDLLFTARLQGCRLYLNKGNFRFEDISESSGVAQYGGLKTGVTVVDIDADGFQDLYVCRTWLQPLPERRNLLLRNNGNNTFTDVAAERGLDDLSASQQALFVDYDLDGDLDCYLMNHPVDFKTINNADFKATAALSEARFDPPRNEFESDRLYRNEGGKFIDVSISAGIHNRAFGLSVHAHDFNNDRYPDIFVGNDFIMPDFLYINNGKGGFSERAPEFFDHLSNHSMGADMADLNGDGFEDLVVLDMLSPDWNRRQKLLNTMQLDRYKDLIAKGYGKQLMQNTLQLSDGKGRFSEVGRQAGIAATEWSWAPLAADYDNDGFCDLFVANGIKRDLNDADFFLYTADSINRTGGVNTGRFSSFEQFSGLMPSLPVRGYFFQNKGKFPLADASEAWGLSATGFAGGAAWADLDNDGDLDLVTNNLESPPSVLKNRAVEDFGRHWLQVKLKGTAHNPFGLGAKIRAYSGTQLVFSREMAVVRGYYSSVEPLWQIGLGEKRAIDRLEIEWLEGKVTVMDNVQADQRLMLNIADAKPGRFSNPAASKPVFYAVSAPEYRHVENEFEDFHRERLLLRRYSALGPALACGDVNGDGLEDFYLGGSLSQKASLWLQNKAGEFTNSEQVVLASEAPFEAVDALFFDADKDGDADLYVVSGGNEAPANDAQYRDRLYWNDGKGRFTAAELPAETSSGACVQSMDYDGDGDADLFVGGRMTPGAYPSPPRSFILQNDGGRFKDVTAQIAPDWEYGGMITGIRFADLDADGREEMICCGEWMPVSVWKFDGKWKNASDQFGLSNSSGWWNCLSVADLDADGDFDIVAGNWGLNSRFSASEKAPLYLFSADFDGNKTLDPVVAQAAKGAYYPVARKSDLGAQMPSIVNKKFTRLSQFAQADVTDIFGEKALDKTLRLEARTLASGWFENRKGSCVFHPFPWQAQVSPVNDILVQDFDRDGRNDILLAGNLTDVETETGSLDAGRGLFLIYKNGEFVAVSAEASGFYAPGDVRKTALLKTSDGKSIVVAKNRGKISRFSY